jgi:hypothetical protein
MVRSYDMGLNLRLLCEFVFGLLLALSIDALASSGI